MPPNFESPGARTRNRTYPAQATSVPGQSLPPTQRTFTRAVTRRGPGRKGSDAADNLRGKGFTLTWNYDTGSAWSNFPNYPPHEETWVDYFIFTDINSAGSPLRRFNQLKKLAQP
jgi:hypothetical protein